MGWCCCSFWREKDEWRKLMDTAEKRAINIWTDTRSSHWASIILPVFFVKAWVSVSLVPRCSLLIRCPREVSVTSQLMVESRNDRVENAWGLGWVSVLSWIWTGPLAQQVWAREPAEQWLQACISMRWLFWFKTNGKDTDMRAGMLKNNMDSAISGKFWKWIWRCLPRHGLSKHQSLSKTVLRHPDDHAHPTFEIDFEMTPGFKPRLDCQSLFGKPAKAAPPKT